MTAMKSTVKPLLALCTVLLLACGRAGAADTELVDRAKDYLADTDRAKMVLFFAHPTATYQDASVARVTGMRDGFSVTMRYSWKSLFDSDNTSDLVFYFNDRGRLTDIESGRTTSFFKQFTGSDIVLDALKDELVKKIRDWDDPDARRTALALIRNADTRALLTLLLQVDQP